MNKLNDQIPHNDHSASESMIDALRQAIQLLDRIKITIEKSSNNMPNITLQLNIVTQATEKATVEMLNKLDILTQKMTTIDEGLVNATNQSVPLEKNGILVCLGKMVAEMKQDITDVMIALQVQDITAQKIAAANHLIESIRQEIKHELQYLEKNNIVTMESSNPSVSSQEYHHPHFDKDASYKKNEGHQERIDKVVQQWYEHH